MSGEGARILVALDRNAQHAQMVDQARVAVREWRRALRSDSPDAEYVAACGMERALKVLIRELS